MRAVSHFLYRGVLCSPEVNNSRLRLSAVFMPDLVSQLGRKFREDREDLIRFVGFAVVSISVSTATSLLVDLVSGRNKDLPKVSSGYSIKRFHPPDKFHLVESSTSCC